MQIVVQHPAAVLQVLPLGQHIRGNQDPGLLPGRPVGLPVADRRKAGHLILAGGAAVGPGQQVNSLLGIGRAQFPMQIAGRNLGFGEHQQLVVPDFGFGDKLLKGFQFGVIGGGQVLDAGVDLPQPAVVLFQIPHPFPAAEIGGGIGTVFDGDILLGQFRGLFIRRFLDGVIIAIISADRAAEDLIPESPIAFNDVFQSAAESRDTGFQPLEQQYPHQGGQAFAGVLQLPILPFLFGGGGQIMAVAVAAGLVLFQQPHNLFQPAGLPVGAFQAVTLIDQFLLGKLDGLAAEGAVGVMADNILAAAAQQDMPQHFPRPLLQGRGQILGKVVRQRLLDPGQAVPLRIEKQFQLPQDVPGGQVLRRSRQQHGLVAAAAFQKIQQYPAALIVVAEIMRLVNQHRAGVAEGLLQAAVLGVIGGGQAAEAQHLGVNDAEPVANPFPHGGQGSRTDNQRIAGRRLLQGQPAQNFRANVGFAQAHHIGDITAVMPFQHRQTGGHGILLIVGQFHRRRRRQGRIAQGVAVQFIEDFQVNQIGLRRGQRPAGLQLFHHPVADRLAFRPQPLKPLLHFPDIAAVSDGIVQLGVADKAAGRKVGAADNGGAGRRFQPGVADIGFGVHPVFQIGADRHPAVGDQPRQGFNAGFIGVLLGLDSGVAAHISHGFIPGGRFLPAVLAGVIAGRRLLGAIAGGDFLLRRPVGTANQQTH